MRRRDRNRGTPEFEFPYRNVPICFALAFDLLAEIDSGHRSPYVDQPAEALLEVLDKERICSDFTTWQQGFTPKEHREMLDRQWRIQHEDEVRAMVWAREDARDKRQSDAHNEEMKTLRQQHRAQLLVFGGLIGAATVTAGILDGLLGRGVDLWPF